MSTARPSSGQGSDAARGVGAASRLRYFYVFTARAETD